MLDKLEGQSWSWSEPAPGMGLATAKAARAAGADVVIVARDRQRLDAARDEVGRRHAAVVRSRCRRRRRRGGDVRRARTRSITWRRSPASSRPAPSPTRPTSCTSVPSTPACGRPATCAPRHRRACRAGGSFTFCSGRLGVAATCRPGGRRGGDRRRSSRTPAGWRSSWRRSGSTPSAPGRSTRRCSTAPSATARQEAMQPYLSTLPLGRLGRPEELAHAVLFLMTNGYVTGTVLHVDGGSLLI